MKAGSSDIRTLGAEYYSAIATSPTLENEARLQQRFLGPEEQAEICVIIVTFNSRDDISSLISSLRRNARDQKIRVIITDNGSIDGTVDRLRQESDIAVVEAPGNLGYAGGINLASMEVGRCDYILILNPDLVVEPGAVSGLLERIRTSGAGVAVPRVLNSDRSTYRSLRREPTIARALGDALLGRRVSVRPAWSAETEYSAASYHSAHIVDWASGAALLIRRDVADQVGPWNEAFFLYSEETEYLRRVRQAGFTVWFEPSSIVVHRGAGSGSSPRLMSLMAVNRVRYAELYMNRSRAAIFRAVVAFAEAVRSHDPDHREATRFILNRSRWSELPGPSRRSFPTDFNTTARGSVVIPACNEESVIARTLTPLSSAAAAGLIEVVVVCNGCTDQTAAAAASIAGITVVEITQASKTDALNAGDKQGTLWPRMYLDADISISAATVLDVLDRLRIGDVLAARPTATMATEGASVLVRSYYRARARMPQLQSALWGGGCYALTQTGHDRFGRFPHVVGDDLFIDSLFSSEEKVIVAADSAVVRTPRGTRDLLNVLRRTYRGNRQGVPGANLQQSQTKDRLSTRATARYLASSVRGPGSLLDALIYSGFALFGRVLQSRRSPDIGGRWERDDSTRS